MTFFYKKGYNKNRKRGILMKTKTIITISRQFGSGGREVAKKLSEKLDIPFYDKELIAIAAAESGIDKDVFESEEYRTSRAFYLLGTIGYTLGSPVTINNMMSLNDRMFMAQSNVIENLANEGPCVIVGRCGDYVLKDRDDVLHVYIHAELEDRKTRAVEEYKIATEDVNEFIGKVDRERANYYNYYTGQKWGNANNYNVSIDSSKFSIDQIVDLIINLVKEK